MHVNRDETSLLSTTGSDDDEDVGADDGAGVGDGVGVAGLDGLQGEAWPCLIVASWLSRAARISSTLPLPAP